GGGEEDAGGAEGIDVLGAVQARVGVDEGGQGGDAEGAAELAGGGVQAGGAGEPQGADGQGGAGRRTPGGEAEADAEDQAHREPDGPELRLGRQFETGVDTGRRGDQRAGHDAAPGTDPAQPAGEHGRDRRGDRPRRHGQAGAQLVVAPDRGEVQDADQEPRVEG